MAPASLMSAYSTGKSPVQLVEKALCGRLVEQNFVGLTAESLILQAAAILKRLRLQIQRLGPVSAWARVPRVYGPSRNVCVGGGVARCNRSRCECAYHSAASFLTSIVAR